VITREWILIVVIVMQVIGLISVVYLVIAAASLGFSSAFLADLGGVILMTWVAISHYILLKKYKALKAERVSP